METYQIIGSDIVFCVFNELLDGKWNVAIKQSNDSFISKAFVDNSIVENWIVLIQNHNDALDNSFARSFLRQFILTRTSMRAIDYRIACRIKKHCDFNEARAHRYIGIYTAYNVVSDVLFFRDAYKDNKFVITPEERSIIADCLNNLYRYKYIEFKNGKYVRDTYKLHTFIKQHLPSATATMAH